MLVDNKLNISADMESILDRLIMDVNAKGLLYFSNGYKDVNGYLMVQCPYHKNGQERRPSAQFRKTDGLFYCFNCKEVHSLPAVISYVLDENGKSWLLSNFDGSILDGENIVFDLPELETKREEKGYIDKSVLKKYRFTHPYMYERKLTLDVIRKFDIGYDEDFTLVTTKNGKTIEKHVGECITFPNKDEKGNICFIARRAIHTKFFHYPDGAEKIIYGLYEIYREMRKGVEITEVYVCESMLDALVIWSWGKYAIALNGTGTKEQYEILKNSDLVYLILATDNDKAGRDAREKFREHVTNKLIDEIDYASYNGCKDINEFNKDQFLSAKIV